MPQLATKDFEEFEQFLRGVDGRYVLSTRTTCEWRLNSTDIEAITLMWGQDGAGNIFRASVAPGLRSLFIPLACGPGIAINGQALEPATPAWMASGHEFRLRAEGPNRWLAVMIPADVLQQALVVHGRDPDDAQIDGIVAGPVAPAAVASLVDLALRQLRVRSGRPVPKEAHDVAQEQTLRRLIEIFPSMRHSKVSARGRPRVSRQIVTERALAVIDMHRGQHIPLEELVRECGVSTRTLHSVFMQQFGMSPHQFVIQNRLHGIHKALRCASEGETVSGICARFGVWDFGRFAQLYRRHFGLPPSAMLGLHQRSTSR